MRSIHVKNISKSYHGEDILRDLSLTIPAGKFFALLGPSGCGKTTLLRLIGGFEKADSGHIYLGSEDITNRPSPRVNTVFQNYALFPHMNVFENVAYSLSIRNVAKEEIHERVVKILKSFDLEKHIYKSIDNLSGGQQQRVALARAIINKPDVLLLDEPLAALDFKLRERMLVELIELQEELETTFVYVTHDQFEALTVADQMAIMSTGGKIEQIGTPQEIYEYPRSTFVAKFVGTTNIISGSVQNLDSEKQTFELQTKKLGDLPVKVDRAGWQEKRCWIVDGHHVYMSVRPEKIFIDKERQEGFACIVEGIVEALVYHGRSTQYNVRLHDSTLVRVFEQNEEHSARPEIDYDEKVFLHWHPSSVVVLER